MFGNIFSNGHEPIGGSEKASLASDQGANQSDIRLGSVKKSVSGFFSNTVELTERVVLTKKTEGGFTEYGTFQR